MPSLKQTPVFLALVLAGCATLQLTPRGNEVGLLTNPPADILTSYQDLGTITCSKGVNARRLQTNAVQCQNELRNKTSELGGILVVVTSQQLGHKCGNCVTMVGTAYGRNSS